MEYRTLNGPQNIYYNWLFNGQDISIKISFGKKENNMKTAGLSPLLTPKSPKYKCIYHVYSVGQILCCFSMNEYVDLM